MIRVVPQVTVITCDHPEGGPGCTTFRAQGNATEIVPRARQAGWFVSVLHTWANCPTCLAYWPAVAPVILPTVRSQVIR